MSGWLVIVLISLAVASAALLLFAAARLGARSDRRLPGEWPGRPRKDRIRKGLAEAGSAGAKPGRRAPHHGGRRPPNAGNRTRPRSF